MPKLTPGFTLLEAVLSIFIILALVTMLIIATSSYGASRGSNLQSLATKIASRQLENLHKGKFASLPACPSPTGCNISDSDLAKLPSGTAKQFIDTYQSSSQIKQIAIQVDWIINGATKQIKVETLMSQDGL